MSHQDKKENSGGKSGIAGDERNILVLLFLYILQGIPLGIAAAIPLILTNRNVSYKQQAEFSFAYWPFSVKLLWAPIVASCHVLFSQFSSSNSGHSSRWLGPDHAAKAQCWLCLHLQLGWADCWLFPGLCLLHGPGELWTCHSTWISPVLGSDFHDHHYFSGCSQV